MVMVWRGVIPRALKMPRSCTRSRVAISTLLSTPSPATVTVPLVGLSSPAIRFSSVDFPLPDGPMTATASPGATCRFTSSSAGCPRLP
jgi:hypothetical protein